MWFYLQCEALLKATGEHQIVHAGGKTTNGDQGRSWWKDLLSKLLQQTTVFLFTLQGDNYEFLNCPPFKALKESCFLVQSSVLTVIHFLLITKLKPCL